MAPGSSRIWSVADCLKHVGTVEALYKVSMSHAANVPEPEFIEPKNWLPNSLDLILIDYSIWKALQQLVYRQNIRNLDHMREVLTSCWEQIRQNLIDKVINQWLMIISLVM